jgi:hypothetical protein
MKQRRLPDLGEAKKTKHYRDMLCVLKIGMSARFADQQ